jgi:hypothetical protein
MRYKMRERLAREERIADSERSVLWGR